MGLLKGISFLGYDVNEKVYTYHGFDSTGGIVDAKGTLDGATWNWTSKMGRVTIKNVSRTEYTFKLEMSQNGKEFSTVRESVARKVSATAWADKP